MKDFMDIHDETANLYLDLMKRVLTASIYEESAWQVEDTRSKNHFKNIMVQRFKRKSMVVVKKKAYDAAEREEGKDWPLFGYTMTGHRRLDNVRACVESVLENNVPGDFIETGVWRGGTTIFMRAMLKVFGVTDRVVWAADSFEGLPVPKDNEDGWDVSEEVALKVSLEQVQANFEKFGLLDEQVRFLKGWFCDTLPTAPIETLAILRLDGDLYSSTMDALDNLFPKVSKGGFVIVDDYYSWPACERAVTDYLTKHSITADIQKVDWTGAYWQVQ